MKKLGLISLVQVKYFNKDDIIKKNGYTIYSRMRSFLFLKPVICLLFYYFYRS